MFTEPEDNEDDVEVFKDAPEPENEKENDADATSEDATKGLPTSSYQYDGRKREPQYANAQNSCLWEIKPLLSHYHPSVALHASQLLYGQNITTKPDLELHTLSHFLDRFVYRNPKKALPNNSGNAMKPGGKGQDVSGLVLMRKGASAPTITSEIPLNNENFAKQNQNDIPVDQLFFHRYFSQKLVDEENVRDKQGKNKKRKRGKGGDDEDDSDIDSDDEISIADDDAEAGDLIPNQSDMEDNEEDDDSDLDEDEVWKAMQASMPPAVGDADLMEDDSGSEAGSTTAGRATAAAAGSEGDDDDISAGEFAYSDSDEDQDAAMDAILAGEEDEDSDAAAEEGENSDLGEDEDMPSFFHGDDDDMNDVPTFDENEDDLIGSDEDIVLGDNIKLPASAAAGKKESKNKKRKLKHLPAFASAEDWADLIEGHDSE